MLSQASLFSGEKRRQVKPLSGKFNSIPAARVADSEDVLRCIASFISSQSALVFAPPYTRTQ